ncbi:MAG: hypothetical protein IPN43_11990 [Chitinophagaceae bacterium]|nr:hypothetical protein [Chitinophagaceae bacterium]MBK8787180.1 hypothetical protein [Chitinophagaceae bacterium]
MTNKFKILITAVVSILVINSCYDKNESLTILPVNYANNVAYVKFINTYAASNPSTVTPASGPSVNVYVNGAKINAAPLGHGGSFPLSPSYTAVAPGLAINIKVILNRTNNTPVAGDTISNKNYDLGINSYTTFYIADTTPNPTPLNPYVVPIQELINDAPVGYFRARFVNMIPSTDTLEVFSKRLNAVIFSGQLYKNATPMVELPTFITSDTLQLRKVSAPATVLGTINGFFPTSARVYTVYCTGNITGTPRARVLTSFTNR